MLCYVMLCYVMSCHVMLCHVMSCYVMLCYVMLCYVMTQNGESVHCQVDCPYEVVAAVYLSRHISVGYNYSMHWP